VLHTSLHHYENRLPASAFLIPLFQPLEPQPDDTRSLALWWFQRLMLAITSQREHATRLDSLVLHWRHIGGAPVDHAVAAAERLRLVTRDPDAVRSAWALRADRAALRSLQKCATCSRSIDMTVSSVEIPIASCIGRDLTESRLLTPSQFARVEHIADAIANTPFLSSILETHSRTKDGVATLLYENARRTMPALAALPPESQCLAQ
jgi:hypothetical protein